MSDKRNKGEAFPRRGDVIIRPTDRQDQGQPARPRKKLPPPKKTAWLGYLALILITLAAYAPMLKSDMIWSEYDEPERSRFTSMEHWSEAWHLSEIRRGNPFEVSSYFFEKHLPFPTATTHHAINILLHLFAALLLLKTLEALKLPAAFSASLVFALHPSVVPVIFWSGYRGELIALIFLLAALFFGVRNKNARDFGWLLVFSLLAFFVHPGTLVLPLVLGLCIYASRGSTELKDYNRILPLLCFALFIGVWTQGASQSAEVDAGNPLSIAAVNLFFFLKQALLPIQLALFHPLQESADYSVGAQYSFLPFLIFIPLYGLIFVNIRKNWARALLLGLTGYLLLVIYGLTHTGSFVDGSIAHQDYLQYLAMPALISLVICTAGGVVRSIGSGGKYIWYLGFAIFVSIQVSITATFSYKLSDQAQVWQTLIEQWPDSWEPKLALINTVREQEEDSDLLSRQDMIDLLDSVLSQQPDRIEERQLLARVYRDLGQNANALREYRRILRETEPDDLLLEEAATFYDSLGLSWDANNARERISE